MFLLKLGQGGLGWLMFAVSRLNSGTETPASVQLAAVTVLRQAGRQKLPISLKWLWVRLFYFE
jgi:hypothetical protein